jgi:glucose-1-phosphatase
MRPEFIYFDLGNVICFFDRQRQIRQVAKLSGIADEKAADLLIGSVGLHWRYETGEIDDQQFHQEFCRASGSNPELTAFHRANSEIFSLNASLLPLLAHLEDSQIPLGILSNTGPAHWRTVTDGRYKVLPGAFRKHVLSFEVGALKPDERIFRRAIELAGTLPEKILYIDDIADYVEAGRRVGLDAVQYTTTDALAKELLEREVRSNY